MTWPLGVLLGWEDCIVRGESVLQEMDGLYCSRGKKKVMSRYKVCIVARVA